MKLFSVITTINPPTPTVQSLALRCADRVIVIGDLKTPVDWSAAGSRFYSYDEQKTLGLSLVPRLRFSHYTRKNIGYLQAMRGGADVIYDTDDDNVPSSEWQKRSLMCDVRPVVKPGWCNVYRYFHNSDIWPRGFGLTKLGDPLQPFEELMRVDCPVQQGLADGEPDVDAIWRLAAVPSHMRGRITLFRDKKSVWLGTGVWCPFNSQTTWWFEQAHPLMYLPIHASFRMTDIWRSFIAQRCLWEIGRGVAFHSPSEVVQKRNEHDLLRDFADEVPGYLANEKIAEALEKLSLDPGEGAMTRNLVRCYEKLTDLGYFPPDELAAVRAWVDDVERIKGGHQ